MKKRNKIIITIILIILLIIGLFHHITNGDLIFWVPREEVYDVVLDPGHGDYDPGCVYDKYQEKDFNLDMAIKVKNILEQQGLKVKLTREEDIIQWEHNENADLRARVAQAITYDPIVFVSMHINASTSIQANGFEIYASEFRTLSQTLANNIYEQVQSLNYFKGRGVITSLQKSLFMVDMNTKPAILIETGFLTNEDDRNILLNEEYNQQICEKIATGIYQTLIQSKEYQKRYQID